MTTLSELDNIIICVGCEGRAVVLNFSQHYNLRIYGEACCKKCVDNNWNSLDFSFEYCILSGVIICRAYSREYGQGPLYLEYNVSELSPMPRSYNYSNKNLSETPMNNSITTSPNIFALTTGSGAELCLVMVTPNHRLIDGIASKFKDGVSKIHSYTCSKIPRSGGPFKVFVVTVGEGASYRIVDIFVDKKRAYKVATSLTGSVSTLEAMRDSVTSKHVEYYKYFIPLESHDLNSDRDEDEEPQGEKHEYHYIDHFSRKEAIHSESISTPMVTRRRRYSSSLPYRFEVAASRKAIAQRICISMTSQLKAGEVNFDDYEYNVDYPVATVDGIWGIDSNILK